MMAFECDQVYSGWPSVSNPDDLVVTIRLDRTTHEFYPSVRELLLMYDAVAHRRDVSRVVGTADQVSISHESNDMVQIELPPLAFSAERSKFVAELEAVLRTVFEEKDRMASQKDREEGLSVLQSWLDEQSGATDVRELYDSVTASE